MLPLTAPITAPQKRKDGVKLPGQGESSVRKYHMQLLLMVRTITRPVACRQMRCGHAACGAQANILKNYLMDTWLPALNLRAPQADDRPDVLMAREPVYAH